MTSLRQLLSVLVASLMILAIAGCGAAPPSDMAAPSTEPIESPPENPPRPSPVPTETGGGEVRAPARPAERTVDDILDELKQASIAFNTPRQMNYEDTTEIQLKLSMESAVKELKGMIDAAGPKVGARIKVSNRMKATLTGSGFEIEAVTPEVQAVTRSGVTEWKWEVKPKDEGSQRLHLNLAALITVDGESVPRSIKTFDKIIEVEVTLVQKAKNFVDDHLDWVWAVLVVPVFGLFLARRKKKGKSEE